MRSEHTPYMRSKSFEQDVGRNFKNLKSGQPCNARRHFGRLTMYGTKKMVKAVLYSLLPALRPRSFDKPNTGSYQLLVPGMSIPP